jgi:hypothetical protein
MSDDDPSVSAAFRAGSDPSELRAATIALARAVENARAVDKVHWSEIKRLDTATEKISGDLIQLLLRINKLETRMAIYAAIGAAFGGGMVAVAMKLIFK